MSLVKTSLVVVVLACLSGCTAATVSSPPRDAVPVGTGSATLLAVREPAPPRAPVAVHRAPCWRCS